MNISKEKIEKYLELVVVGIVFPVIVAIISHFIEYRYFNTTTNGTSVPVSVSAENTSQSVFIKRRIKFLTYEAYEREYSWVSKYLGCFFAIFPVLLVSIFAIPSITDEILNLERRWIMVAEITYWILIYFLLVLLAVVIYWFILFWVLLFIHIIFYFFNSRLNVDAITYAVKIYEDFINYVLSFFAS